MSIKSRPNSPVTSTSKNGVIRCPTCEEEYCDPPTEEWIQYCKCQAGWHDECSNYENGTFICEYLPVHLNTSTLLYNALRLV
ncbi:uncharacterized protein TNCV_432261 [Trichonephila clavipes]|nr:uncharacterized protein TNCV_432261 [Trichonephila clavipes]